MIGVLGTLAFALLVTRLRGEGWGSLGMSRPPSWPRALGMAALGTLFNFALGWLVALVLVPALFGDQGADLSRFEALRGNLAGLIGTVVIVWLTAAFAEEVVYRGFLMGRVARALGGSRSAWTMSLVASSALFGALHWYQGPVGVLSTAIAGLALGVIYLWSGRNLWICILVHGLTDTVSLTLIYLGVG